MLILFGIKKKNMEHFKNINCLDSRRKNNVLI